MKLKHNAQYPHIILNDKPHHQTHLYDVRGKIVCVQLLVDVPSGNRHFVRVFMDDNTTGEIRLSLGDVTENSHIAKRLADVGIVLDIGAEYDLREAVLGLHKRREEIFEGASPTMEAQARLLYN